jgi:CBS domain-containing protein
VTLDVVITMKHLHNRSDVVCVTRDTSLHDAARLMRERRIGSLVVTDPDGCVAGIVTDRDICLRAVAFERDPHTTLVGAVMTAEVRRAAVDGLLEEWTQPMRCFGVRRVPLTDTAGRPQALFAADDWLRWLAARLVDVSITADPAHRHGPLRQTSALLDELTQHLEARQLLHREELLEAISRLRGACGAP